MEKQKFVIHLVGRPCSGKSTLESLIGEKVAESFRVDYDHLKWQLSDYHRDKHRDLVQRITRGLYETVCAQQVPLVLLNLFAHNEQDLADYKKIAESNGYKFISVLLTAPDEVLVERFRKRLEHAQKIGQKVSIVDEQTFRSWLATQYFFPSDAIEFDTSKVTMESVRDEILSIMV